MWRDVVCVFWHCGWTVPHTHYITQIKQKRLSSYRWHRLAYSVEGQKVTLFLDCQEVATLDLPRGENPKVSTDGVTVFGTRLLDEEVFEVRVWKCLCETWHMTSSVCVCVSWLTSRMFIYVCMCRERFSSCWSFRTPELQRLTVTPTFLTVTPPSFITAYHWTL